MICFLHIFVRTDTRRITTAFRNAPSDQGRVSRAVVNRFVNANFNSIRKGAAQNTFSISTCKLTKTPLY